MCAKVLLLNPPSKHGVAVVRDTLYGCWCKGRANYMWPPLGLLYVGATLRKYGHEPVLLDSAALRHSVEDAVKKAVKEKPDYVVVNTATITFSNDAGVVKKLKEELPETGSIFLARTWESCRRSPLRRKEWTT